MVRRYAWSWEDVQPGLPWQSLLHPTIFDTVLIGSPDLTNEAIGRQFGVSRETVRRRRKELEGAGVIRAPRSVRPPGSIRNCDATILQLWRMGWRLTAIGRRIGYHRSSVRRRLRELKATGGDGEGPEL